MTTTPPTIISITARQIFDSRGNPTVEYVANLAGNKNLLLPVPAFNVINGGSHAGNKLVVQKYGQDATNVGDKGGFAPNVQTCLESVEDLSAPFQDNDGSQRISGDALKDLYKSFAAEYQIVEDPFGQDDWERYAKLTDKVEKAIKEKSCNALLLKVNQIGPVTDGIEAVKMSRRAGGIMASYCSGETEDTFIADLSVGLATGQIKTEAACRSERLAKYNQLLRIEEELESTAVYAAAKFRMPVDPY